MTDAPRAGPCCAIGARPDAAEIDAALRAGGPLNSVRKVGERYGLGRTAVSDHRGCLGLRTVGTDGARQPADAACRQADNVDSRERTAPDTETGAHRSVLDESRRSRRRIKSLISGVVSGAMEPEIAKAAAPLYAQHRGHLDLEAKILGDIKQASTTVNVYQTADWKQFRDLLVEALAERHPAAFDDVMALIEQTEGGRAVH